MTRPLRNLSEIAVIGGGLAGLAAARQAARRGRLVTLFEGGGIWGGLAATVDDIDGLGVPGRFSGQDIAMSLLGDARKVGVQVIESPVTRLDTGSAMMLTTDDGAIFHPEAVIVASGAALRPLGVPGEAELAGRGVSRCATCDGGFFRGQDVAVIGGGDAAVTEALVLARTSSAVHMVCRSPLRAKREYVDALASKANVHFVWDNEVTAIAGDNDVTGVALRHVRTGEASLLACAGVFPFIGVDPVSGFLPAALLNDGEYIVTDARLTSGDPRIFAAGAVRAGYGGHIAQAMAEGMAAADAAARFLAK